MEKQVYTVGMEAAKTIYKILAIFENSLDYEKFDTRQLEPEHLGISKQRRDRYLQMLVESEYIAGVTANSLPDGSVHIDFRMPRITLKGIEYLADNSVMQKVVGFIKKGAEITIPALI